MNVRGRPAQIKTRQLRREHTYAFFESTDFADEQPVERSWNISLDDPTPIPGSSYGVPARSIVILEDRG